MKSKPNRVFSNAPCPSDTALHFEGHRVRELEIFYQQTQGHSVIISSMKCIVQDTSDFLKVV